MLYLAVGDINCKTCGGEGVVQRKGRFVKCPDCYKVSIKDMTQIKEDDLTDREIVEELNKYNAPDYVKNESFGFDYNKLVGDMSISQDIREDIEFEAYVMEMERIVNEVKEGSKLSNSYIISSNKGFGKSYFIWDVIKSYVKMGKKVSKFLTSEDIINLKTFSNAESIEELREYYNSDVIILNLSGSLNKPRLHILAMFEVLNKVGGMNKPMIVISTYRQSSILRQALDYERGMKFSGVEKGKYDTLKVVEYFAENGNDNEYSFKNNR